jgi:prefoldin subunit 5
MTTDERLDRLVERHEALTQSVESLTRDVEGMRGFISEIAQGTARLLRIVEVH